jgi:hypothetical protein
MFQSLRDTHLPMTAAAEAVVEVEALAQVG